MIEVYNCETKRRREEEEEEEEEEEGKQEITKKWILKR
jgi:hypothetical protein